jgi:chorismate synthase
MQPMATEQQQEVVIRDIVDLAELRELEQLQRDVWGVADLDVFPALALRPIIAVGGLLMGAFVNGRMAGFVFGFLGLEGDHLILHSDMLAVRPEYRSQKLGYKLKLAQRQRAIEQGIDRITWTFDPLQLVNANLNFSRLGVISDRYLVNFYGETTSFLHSSGTDRLWLTWLLNSERVRGRLENPNITLSSKFDEAVVLVRVAENEEPIINSADASANAVVIEIPPDINSLPGELKARWREATRQAFTSSLDQGYVVEEFSRAQDDGRKRGLYLLTLREE